MTVKYFGKIAELINVSTEQWPEAVETVADFKTTLISKYPQLSDETLNIAVNFKLETNDFKLSELDEIAIMPPFAGG